MAHIRKRGKTYSYTITVKRDATGKREQVTKGGFTRKKDAEVAARKIETELDENRYINPSKEIFSTFMENWFTTHYQNSIKQTTASSRRYILEKHLLRENPFVNKEISLITTEDIDALYNLKLDQDYSTSYIRKMHQMSMQVFNQAMRWKKIVANPVSDADPPSV